MDPVSRPRWMVLVCALAFPSSAAAESVRSVFETSAPAGLGGAFDALAAEKPALALTRLATAAPELHVWSAYIRAEALFALNRPAEVAAALDSAPLPATCGGHPQDQARIELRSRALAKIDPQRALLVGSSTIGESGHPLPPASKFWAWLRTVGSKRAQPKLHRALERRILLEAPGSGEAKKLVKEGALDRLSRTDRIDRVRSLLRWHANKLAFEEAALIQNPSPQERCQLELIQGIAERKRRHYSAAIKLLSRARLGCLKADDPKGSQRAALWEQRVRGIRRDVNGTKRIAQWFETNWPNHSYTDDLWFLHARALEGRKRKAEALKIYERMATKTPDGDMIADAAWRQAQQALQLKKNNEARKHLERVLDSDPKRQIDGHRAHYWIARITDGAEGLDALEKLARHPSYYGWVALQDLSVRDPARAKTIESELQSVAALPQKDVELPAVWKDRPELKRAALFAADGLLAEAIAEIESLACTKPAPGLRIALAAAYDAVGRKKARSADHAAPEAFRLAQMSIRRRSKDLLEAFDADHLQAWRLAYSRPFFPLVHKAAKQAKVEPLLLFALAREESTFDPDIVSWAGATGLTQVMPSTAIGAYADVYRKRLTDMSKLTDPQLNLRLGAHVLRQGMRRFGKVPLALSAYNGGVGLTKKTLPEKPLLFVDWSETNPVRENRRYVKKVVQSWGIYRLLYDRKEPFIELPRTIKRMKR